MEHSQQSETVPLSERTAVVTGASRGIGRATAKALADEGVQVAVTARTQTDLDEVVDDIQSSGGQAVAIPADLRKENDVQRLHDEAREELGTIDILVNNAGVGKYAPLEDLTADDYDWIMDTNMRSTFLCTRAFLPAMKERGNGWVVFVASVAGLNAFPEESVYCASKHAQVAFARSLDHEVRESGVKISVIAPGGVNTHFAFGTGRSPGDESLQEMLEPETVAESVVYAVDQPPKSRVFLVGMRPMSEDL